ncbi:MAG: hypothetical protein WB460_15065 [Candidatus Acidiferrales bacterium]
MKKQKKSLPRKRKTKSHRWEERLKKAGLPVLRPGFIPRSRGAAPLVDEDGDELERAAALSLDRMGLVHPWETQTRVSVTPGAFLKLADYLQLSSVARTVLAMRLLNDASREDVRQYYLREHPEEVSDAMTAWRQFSERMPEVRAFLEGYRRDKESPVKPNYRLIE